MVDISDSTVFKQVDADNITGLPSYPEGMAVSEFNNNLRSTQGALARWYARTNPTVRSTGSGTAQTVSYDVAPLSYIVGDVYRFICGVTNTGPTTLNFGPGDVPVVAFGAPLVGGEMVEDWIACVGYTGAGQFELLNPHGRIVGDLVLGGDLTVDAITTIGDATIGGDTTITGELHVTGPAYLGDVALTGNFHVDGISGFADVVVGGSLSLQGPLIVDGTEITLLGTNKTYYISPAGSDVTGDGSTTAPWNSLAHAGNVIQSTVNFGNYKVTLLLEPGVYPTASTGFAPTTGNWEVTSASGNASDTTIAVSGVQADGIHASGSAQVYVHHLTIGAGGGYALAASGPGFLRYGDVVLTPSVSLISAFDGGNIQADGNAVMTAGTCATCFLCDHASLIASSSGDPMSYTATGAMVFSSAFAICAGGGYIRAVSGTFSGISATGPRFGLMSNGVINSGGEDPATFFPGDSVGVINTGAQWV